ncbi:cytochrome d ubiquinol oxidase subunit I [Kribbella orskensis]|uniref:Cytochrome d ubiquinol oxidase subunit I n=1 Tax=Kribbella orskensis TaxID=2512216 RepID=A0ABY2BFR6_9ACTN|nr:MULTISPECIES: cytochrome ubiquinol oxidase subunit I [Kribbella]TCN37568.1 cytochrome d ubiquinol oxidase subunit I [Kribbella sp. VKM Ac-2500]TCO18930.1 cytochrome d ubiquinol oxidase subunit I [Kribbella orskensis]
MDTLDLARWQFAITTVYHFFFVPVTLSLVAITAGLQTAWVRTGKDKYLRLTKFYGKLFLINIAMGVVTGLVQEFQFGMNWSDYSRFVGDVFGAPLALEGLLAFFLESTFIGLWIFGWDRLPKKIHLACIWMVVLGSQLSAYFILAANSWMQNPVGFRYNAERGRAELTDIGAVLTNKVVLVTYPHTIFAAFMVGGAFVAGVAIWHLVRHKGVDTDAFRTAMRLGAVVVLVAGAGVALSGDQQGKVMTEVQPMKMAAAEALYQTEKPASFSIFTIGTLDGSREIYSLKVPYLLSFLATGHFEDEVKGINSLQEAYEQLYGPGSYHPNIPLTYWTFRLMIGVGMASAVIAVWLLWTTRRGRAPAGWLAWVALPLPLLPLAANSFGWIFTETGRQPWLVFGLLPTAAGVSPGTTTSEVLTSMIGFTLLYGALAVVEVKLMFRAIRAGLDPVESDDAPDQPDKPLSFAY